MVIQGFFRSKNATNVDINFLKDPSLLNYLQNFILIIIRVPHLIWRTINHVLKQKGFNHGLTVKIAQLIAGFQEMYTYWILVAVSGKPLVTTKLAVAMCMASKLMRTYDVWQKNLVTMFMLAFLIRIYMSRNFLIM